jgi:hypothetical protein
MRVYKLLWLSAIFAVMIPTVLAQEDHSNHANHGLVGWVPRELLERPTTLREGTGKANDVVTATATAQAFYNQGVAYLHGYV